MSITILPTLCCRTASADAASYAIPGADSWSFRLLSPVAAEAWPLPLRLDNFWLQPAVLAQINELPGQKAAVVVLENSKDYRRVLLTIQQFDFRAGGQFNDSAGATHWSAQLRRTLLRPFSFPVLVIGQLLVSGGYSADGLEKLSDTEAIYLLPRLADILATEVYPSTAILLKDLYPAAHPVAKGLVEQSFFSLPVEPVMHMEIPAAWTSVDDYLAALKSKYRVRYRRARSKQAGVCKRVLSPAEVMAYQARIFALYQQTMDGADYKPFSLTAEYFTWISQYPRTNAVSTTLSAGQVSRETTSSATQLCGYFNEAGEMVGFTSAIFNNQVMHAHFLGVEENYKHSHHLYHNMLLDLLVTAIEEGCAVVDFSRTATEIKSSIGAAAASYACLLKVKPAWVNRLVPLFTPAVYQATSWVPRSPFSAS